MENIIDIPKAITRDGDVSQYQSSQLAYTKLWVQSLGQKSKKLNVEPPSILPRNLSLGNTSKENEKPSL
jgi:hypothetical protein